MTGYFSHSESCKNGHIENGCGCISYAVYYPGINNYHDVGLGPIPDKLGMDRIWIFVDYDSANYQRGYLWQVEITARG